MRPILHPLLALALLCGAAAAQTAPRIGPTFGAELQAAGCANGVSWLSDGTLALSPGTDPACPNRVLAAHDPTKAMPPAYTVEQLLDCLSATQRAAITADHMARLMSRATIGPLPVGDGKLARAAADIGITPAAWFAMVPGGS